MGETALDTNVSPERSYKEVQFLIVDDDAISVMSIERAIKKLRLVNPIRNAHDGSEALDILRGTNGQSKIEAPFVIILDLDMPGMNGIEFLEEVRNDPELKSAVIFVLTASDAPEDVTKAYEKNIAGYVVKENAYDTFRQTLAMIDTFSSVVVLPT